MARNSRDETDAPALASWGIWDKLALQAILVGVAIYALIVLISGVVMIVSSLASGDRQLSLAVDGDLPADASTGAATLLDGHYESAWVSVTDLGPLSSSLLTVGLIVNVVAQVLVAASFVYLAFRLLRRRPFMKSLTWVFVTAGAALLIGSLVSQGLTGLGSWMVAGELGSTPGSDDFWVMAISIDLAPLGFGFALMLVGSAFEYAQKLSRETEGLV